MDSSGFKDADYLRRKRSASQNPSPTFAVSFHSPKKVEYSPISPTKPVLRTLVSPYRHTRKSSWDKSGSGRRPSLRSANMQSPTHSTFANSALPSFMSIYNSSLPSNQVDAHTTPDQESCFSPVDPSSFNPFHQPRNSTSTSASDSTDSSPTTTVSLDSSSITDPSPGASPQSPSSMSFAMDSSRFTALDSTKPDSLTVPFEQPRPTTPAKKARNLKNLAVNTSAAYNLGRAIATAPLKTDGPEQTSAPASPAFVKPPTPPKRKLGTISLTIMTPGNSNMAVPPTPSITRPATLRHFQSSPSLPLYTAGAGPVGGMTLPKIRAQPVPRGFAEIPQEEEEEEEEQNFDVPQSQEEKPESYPNGPIRIYESGVDLYYEPSVEVASRYDVIINVASEVKNPFDVEEEARKALQVPSNNVGIITEKENAGSPTTPKATPISTENPPLPLESRKRPEYIHIPWEHNTDIVPDLYHLVQTIDERVKQNKNVLVHCQCGVSRSASLIVAYGLYKNPEISVQEAYEAVKKRSKWIGPNMSLIMQLQEFKNGMTRNLNMPRKTSVLPSASTIDTFDFESKSPSEPATPRTAPFNPDALESPDVVPSSMGPFSAGPVEPGTGFWERAFSRQSWTNATSKPLPVSVVTDMPYVDTKGHVVPIVTVVQQREPPPVRQVEMVADRLQTTFRKPNYNSDLPLRRDYDTDATMTDAPELPTVEPLLSPRSTEFHMAPLKASHEMESLDTFNLFSPNAPEFPKEFTPQKPSASLMDSPPPPKRAAPPPPREFQMESLNSIFSPTSTFFPPVQPLTLNKSERQFPERIDSLVPLQSPPSQTFVLAPPPRKNSTPRKLRAKVSAPNLSQIRQLEKLQKEISESLPKRPAEAEEALMSPRVENFVGNPFHTLRTEPVIREDDPRLGLPVQEETEAPLTPGSEASDPRSPAQFGISPITRSIWGMI